LERTLGQGNEVLFQLRGQIKEFESQMAYERRERASLAEANEARAVEKEQLQSQQSVALEEAERVGDELRGVETALGEAGEAMRLAEAEARNAEQTLRGFEQDRDSQNQGLVEVLTSVARAEDRQAALADRRAEIDRRLRSADEQLEVQQGEASRADQEQLALEEGLRNLLAERDRLMGLVRDALAGHAQAVEAARVASEQLQAQRELRETRRARLTSLQELLSRQEDVGQGARHLLRLGDDERRALGLRGLVRDAFDADPGVEKAVEAVLAERAEALVVENGPRALDALAALRRSSAGRAVLVLQQRGDDQPLGFVPMGEPLLGRVAPRPGSEAVARSLLGRVNLVESLREPIEHYGAGSIPCTFVTPAGDLLTRDGVVHGGGDASQTGILTRVREVRELEDEVASLDREMEEHATARRASEQRLANASDELENLRNRHHTAALAVANHEKDLERTRERVKAIGEAQEGRVAERSELLAEVEAILEEAESLERRLVGEREDRLRRQRTLEQLGLQIGSSGREVSRLEAVATERRVLHEGREDAASRLRSALERAEASVQESRDWIQRRDAEMQTAETRRADLAQRIAEAEQNLARRLEEEEVARLGNEEKRDAYEQQASWVRELEEEARGVRIDLEARRDEAQQAELGLREQELRLQHLDESIREKWSVDIVHWKPPAPSLEPDPTLDQPSEDDDPTLARSAAAEDRDARREAREIAEMMALDIDGRRERLVDVRGRVEAIGEVNLGAIEEHEELRERFRFLGEQKGDLESSVAQLRDAISRINRTSRKRFRETFDAVKERFEKNFPRMFRGGKASLGLTESEDVLEAGIDIMAQPPGKRLQSVNLLSGGEKTMTAIALLVSVFQVRPSPFFLLDEVDAALDDANVGRFNEIVREMAEDSQFLLITHNKRTIEIADILYGVTMEEKGVSKLVAVEVH
ncbi:MAG: AAA family ATPase, partial [bacterium]|nr:AAA family ATPase [bacterium]